MDQHPIPQDVTGFQFKLIGAMTVKQFGYVAVGVIIAVLLWYIVPWTVSGIVTKIIFIPLCGGGGVAIAFVPIEGRPVDVMAMNFLKAFFNPNQYIYQKVGRRFVFSTITSKAQAANEQDVKQKISTPEQKIATNKEERLRALLNNSRVKVKNKLDEKEMAFFKTLPSYAEPATTAAAAPATSVKPANVPTISKSPAQSAHGQILPASQTQPPAQTQPQREPQATPTPPGNPETLAKKEAILEQEIAQAKKEEAATHGPEALSTAHQKVTDLEKQLQTIHAQKQLLEQELIRLKNQLGTPAHAAPVPTAQHLTVGAAGPSTAVSAPPPPLPKVTMPQPSVRNIPQEMTKSMGLPHISDTPNVVVGIVKDPRGNVLPNMLVEVKDKEGNPVRAFKTNVFGQFASATPLANGMYTIMLEDPKKLNSFDEIPIKTNGQVMLPIEITSHDAREELRKQLFVN